MQELSDRITCLQSDLDTLREDLGDSVSDLKLRTKELEDRLNQEESDRASADTSLEAS